MTQRENADLITIAKKWQAAGGDVAVATVIKTWNSAPRPLGARLIIHQDGRFAGSVSGGCVEKEVIYAVTNCFQSSLPHRLHFGIADETAWQSGLSCGGQIDILVAPLPALGSAGYQALDDWQQAIAQRDSGILITNIINNELIFEKTSKIPPKPILDESRHHFVEPCIPQRRLLIIGATHIAQALAPLARNCDFEVIIIDPRSAWATKARFPETSLDVRWPKDALHDIGIDAQTAVVTLTHDPKIDDDALVAALAAETRYVGALGSTRTHDKRRRRLSAENISSTALRRIHAPVGLDIGAVSVAEIAIAIIAEVLAAYA